MKPATKPPVERDPVVTPPRSAPPVRRLLDKEMAAEYLSSSTDTIERLIHVGVLPVVKLPVERAKNGSHGQVGVSRRVFIDVRDLDALIEQSKERSQ